jgi:sugar/nucleoside kinase (ribokinase family)
MDIWSPDFEFTLNHVEPGGLTKGSHSDMPDFTQEQIRQWIDQGPSCAGGIGNSAPLVSRAGLSVAVGSNLGAGTSDGLDAAGRAFFDIVASSGADLTPVYRHPDLPTAVTFIYDAPGDERGGIVYFANANDDFEFARYRPHVERLEPSVVYYMYSGLSTRADANGGRDLADFMAWCRHRGCLTIADSATLTPNPAELIANGSPVEEYRLLEPLLPELDLFFTSSDEAKMIFNTLEGPRDWSELSDEEAIRLYLDFLSSRFSGGTRSQLFGVTHSRGAAACLVRSGGAVDGPHFMNSKFMLGNATALTGAGDSFRAGLVSYVARNASAFREGSVNVSEAIQMGSLAACLYVTAPLDDRHGNMRSYEAMLHAVRHEDGFASLEELMSVLDGRILT